MKFLNKNLSCLILVGALPWFTATAQDDAASSSLPPGAGRISIEAQTPPPVVPTYFSASGEQTFAVSSDQIDDAITLHLHVVQGTPTALSLGFDGAAEILDVTGPALRGWSIRHGANASSQGCFLDLEPTPPVRGVAPGDLDVTIHTRVKHLAVPGTATLSQLSPGAAVGFTMRTKVVTDGKISLKLLRAEGAEAIVEPMVTPGDLAFFARGVARIDLSLARSGAFAPEAVLGNVRLSGQLETGGRSVEFRLQGQASVARAGAHVRILEGRAALSGQAARDGWHAELVHAGSAAAYDLVFERSGTVPVDLAFAASVVERGDYRGVDFSMPGGAVVSVELGGLGADIAFDPRGTLVPVAEPQGWAGFLPASGHAALAWKSTEGKGEGILSFTSTELTNVRVGAGLLRQESQIAFRIIQGRLDRVRLRVDGPGEIVGVSGSSVLGWKVVPGPEAGTRLVDVALSRPLEGEGTLSVRSQSILGTFPAEVRPLRLSSEGGVRHSGFVRIANEGAVKLEVAGVSGMIQMAPAQYPGPGLDGHVRQVFVYRFPSAERNFEVLASEIFPEVAVSEVVTYGINETDRVIEADVEFDVREAAVRELLLAVPADFGVVTVNGAEVSDFSVDRAVREGDRTLHVLFGHEVEGRQLVHLRLEKNQPEAGGAWSVPPLEFPGAKSVRGSIGVMAVPGFRLTPLSAKGLVEIPVGYFPRQDPALQQAYRVRDPNWNAAVKIEPLPQSIQADLFHLYTLKEGTVYGSVLLNFFVIGSPVNEWRIEVPATAGNIDVSGQGGMREWRRDGNTLIVPLHRPVVGAATLLVTFEELLRGQNGQISPGEIRPLHVQSERGFIEVVSPLQVKSVVRHAEGLLKLEALELPVEFRLLSSLPPVAVYQYTARPFAFDLALDAYPTAETVDQVVDFAQFSSRIAVDGQVVTDARFFVKTRGQRDLRLTLPAGVRLWETRVEGQLVSARSDGGATIIPLAARQNSDEPVRVELKLGQPDAAHGSEVTLSLPTLAVPLVSSRWTLRSDAGHLLRLAGGNAALSQDNLTESGFEWISQRAAHTAGLVLLIALGVLLVRATPVRWYPVGLVAGMIALTFAVSLADQALSHRRVNHATVEVAAMAVAADQSVSVRVANLPTWAAMASPWGCVAAVLGLAGIAAGPRLSNRGSRVIVAAGYGAIGLGLLAQRGGAVGFFGGIAMLAIVLVVIPAGSGLWRAISLRRAMRAGLGRGSAVLPLLLMVGIALAGTPAGRAQVAAKAGIGSLSGSDSAAKLTQRWEIRDGRLFAHVEVEVRAVPGESFAFLQAPAVLTNFASDGLRVTKSDGGPESGYLVSPIQAGTLTAHADYELPLGDLTQGVPILTGPAAVQRLVVQIDQDGWEFSSPRALSVLATPGLEAGHSGATFILGDEGEAIVKFQPKRRDLTLEAARFYSEISTLYVPGPGVVNGYSRISIRPVQGQVTGLDLAVPTDFTVGDVAGDAVDAWRFDPKTGKLHVSIRSARSQVFSLTVETQRGAAALPFDLTLRPLRVIGSAGEIGALGLAFGGEAQGEELAPAGLSRISPADFDATLLPKGHDGRPQMQVQSAYRYAAVGSSVSLRVVAVAPEIRANAREVLSLGEDHLLMATDLNVVITRVGVFSLSFELPPGLEAETISGTALSSWTEAEESGRRLITLHLNGRTLGEQSFALTLSGPMPSARADWRVPQIRLREATRQTGEIQIVPERGLRLRAKERTNVVELDPREVGAQQPGALAFQLLQADAALSLGIEQLDPWVTVDALAEVTLREGQTLTRLGVRYQVDNAPIHTQRIHLLGLSEEQAKTVRASGETVSDCIPVTGSPGVWEIHFQRGVVGAALVQLEFEGPLPHTDGEAHLVPPEFVGARSVRQFVVARGEGRLELVAEKLPAGWQRDDWTSVPEDLKGRSDRSIPALVYRVSEPALALTVDLKRHDLAGELKLRATGGTLSTVVTPSGLDLTALDLDVESTQAAPLRVRLPAGARLYNAFVNGQSMAVVSDGQDVSFNVSPSSSSDRSAKVRVVYALSAPGGDRLALLAPGLNIPLENLTWRVTLPSGYRVAGYQGDLTLVSQGNAGGSGVSDYESGVSRLHSAAQERAEADLKRANGWLQTGNQQDANDLLRRVSNLRSLDEVTNEDARVELRALRTQQAVLGLNTRRQRIYLDNSVSARKNAQLEQAASANPFMLGKLNFDPQQADEIVLGNSAEENAALGVVAARIVDQQLGNEIVPAVVDVTIPNSGQVLTFTHSLQVDGSVPLSLTLKLSRGRWGEMAFGLALAAGLGAIGAFAGRRATGAENNAARTG